MFAKAHLQTALQLVQAYKGEMPFVHYVKQYFSTHRKHGSRDRKQILQLCYAYFRMGKALPEKDPAERMITGLFLGSVAGNPLLQALRSEWNENASVPLAEKCVLAGCSLADLSIFSWTDELSPGVDAMEFSRSHLIQPDLFVRLRPGYEDYVKQKLDRLGIDWSSSQPTAIRLPNGFSVEEHFKLNQQVVVQDLNSQRVGNLLEEVTSMYQSHELFRVWDCCAASGGKSIMTIDRFPSAELTVTDIRSTIIDNLRRRFREAGIYQYQSMVADLSENVPDLAPQDLIIADVPCTGSGTWSRSPENLLTFNRSSIEEYSRLQRRIVTNAVKRLAPDGYLLYITCSVFRKENEENVQHFTEELPLTVISRNMLPGYKEKADSMFAALLKHK